MSAARRLTSEPAYSWGALLMVGAATTVGVALGFEYIGGYSPCPLCLQERYAYYAAVPLCFTALILGSMGHWRWAGLIFSVVALGFLINTGLGVYHAGVEWKWWAGPDTCANPGMAPLGQGGLLESLKTTRVIRCDEAPWRFAGLSFAGWNAVLSALLATIGAKSAALALSR